MPSVTQLSLLNRDNQRLQITIKTALGNSDRTDLSVTRQRKFRALILRNWVRLSKGDFRGRLPVCPGVRVCLIHYFVLELRERSLSLSSHFLDYRYCNES